MRKAPFESFPNSKNSNQCMPLCSLIPSFAVCLVYVVRHSWANTEGTVLGALMSTVGRLRSMRVPQDAFSVTGHPL